MKCEMVYQGNYNTNNFEILKESRETSLRRDSPAELDYDFNKYLMEAYMIQPRGKKRKTRKCLDEMRKRSRSCYKNKTPQKRLHSKTDKGDTNKRCFITNGRLTLKMFPKAICSETITRPFMNDLKVPCLDNNKESPIEKFNITDCEVTSSKIYKETYVSEKSIEIVLSDSEESSTNSLILFSPIISPQNTVINSVQSNVKTLLMSSNSNQNDAYSEYEKCMNEISRHIGKNYPGLDKDEYINDTIKQLKNIKSCYTKNLLHAPVNVYMNSCADQIINKVHMKEIITENPMDYIRSGCGQQYSNQSKLSSDSETSHTDYLHSPFASSPSAHLILSQTPDYAFYPHRLNEST